MIQGNVAPQSRWVLRALWLIAGLVAVAILSVRSSSVLSQSQAMLDGFKKTAQLSFSVPSLPRTVPHSLDLVVWPQHEPVQIHPGVVATVVAGTPLTVSGWAFDGDANATFAGIGAKIDAAPDISYGIINLPRADVATALHNNRARDSGFSSSIDTTNVGAGPHTITLRALAPDQKTAVTLGTVQFVIGSQNLAAQKTDAIDAVNGIMVDPATSQKLPIAVTRSTKRLTIDGWGFVTIGRRLAGSVTLLLDGNPAAAARYGLPRPDVASAYHDVRVTRSGFAGSIPIDTVPAGVHEIRMRMSLSDGTSVDSKSTLRIDVLNYL